MAAAASAFLFLCAPLALVSCATPEGGAPAASDVRVKLVAISDFHGHLQSPGVFGENLWVPPGQRVRVGGAAHLAAHVAAITARNPLHAIVGVGDLVSASPMISALFHDEPAVEALNRIGLEFSAVGNHEFDRGLGELFRLQRGGCLRDGRTHPTSCRGGEAGAPVPFEGAKFQWLAANVVKAGGEPVLPAHGVKSFDGIPVAFIGLTLRATGSIVAPGAVAGLEFRDEADTVNALVPVLREQGIEAIVVLLHQGGAQTAGPKDINGCDGGLAGSALADIVARLDDAVDLVLGAHTHAAYNCSAGTIELRVSDGAATRRPRPGGLPNVVGRLVPVLSPGAHGRVVSDIDLTIDRERGEVVAVAATNRLVSHDDFPAAVIAASPTGRLVAGYEALLRRLASEANANSGGAGSGPAAPGLRRRD